MRYRIGDVARILGISADLLRYYEKKGVVHPYKDKNNDYRYYEPWDINFLLDCLWYKSFGFGIEQIAVLESKSSYQDVYDALEDKTEVLQADILRTQQLLDRLQAHCRELENAKALFEKVDICQSPEVVRYLNRHNFVYDDSAEKALLSQQWLQYMPFVHRCFEIERSDLPGNDGGENYSWGLSLDIAYAGQFGVDCKSPVEHLPARKSLHSVFKSAGKNAFTPQHLDYLMDYARRNGLTVCGNANGNLLCSVVDEGELTGYFEVWLPIE